MKLHLTLAAFLAAALPAVANPATATLTAVDEPGFNEIVLNFSPPILLPDGSDTTELSGSLEVMLEIDPETDQVSVMTITSGNVAGTPVSLEGGDPNDPFSSSPQPGRVRGKTSMKLNDLWQVWPVKFHKSYSLNSSVLGATLATPSPPGTVGPPALPPGDFDASQHTFTVNSGTLGGNVFVPFLFNETISFDFASMPVGGAGSGTGSVSLSPTGSTPTSKSYDVTVLLPISVAENFDVMGIIIPITAVGTAKVTGPATIEVTPANPYLAWMEANSLAGAVFEEDENGDGVPNGLQWGLGLAATDLPFPHLLQPSGPKVFTLAPPAGGT